MGFLQKVFGSEQEETKGTNFYEAVESRRSIYGISNEQVISDERLKEVMEHAVKHTPSSFNSQSASVVVLTGESHKKLWDITTETLRKIVPEDAFSETENKMNGFKSGYGTVLFFENMDVVQSLQEQFPSYAENFPLWSLQSSGMLQHVIWTALEVEGYGASLQHYNPLIDEEVKNEWNVQGNCKLIAQMPFGKSTSAPGEKTFKPLAERVSFYN
ncbi:nitroreductase family protein [Priestia endophytica]|uniref:nitroreductase family protein n=1 Tax=Priestia endophytica TaxID=135735 RepID=UPI00227FB279|nr:nitroreductase family protein [Priestia endophytica]MCY8232872.1 nitroreductase family protein [Priestia endophytica]